VTRALTVADLQALKGKQQLLTIHVDSVEEAAAAEEAGIEILTCDAGDELGKVRAAAPRAFIQVGLPQGAIFDEGSAICEGHRAMDLGASALYWSGSLRLLEAMAREGIPVTGHVGLVPRLATWTNYRSIGKTPEEAAGIYRKVKDYEQAGAWGVEIEVVPVSIAEWITKTTPLITLGMGCGSVCDAQYLFSCDVLGTGTSRTPRHGKQYANIAAEQERLQLMRVIAFWRISTREPRGACRWERFGSRDGIDKITSS
jgi:3-methyl-2-oxobutanoate hydroxymethyltransferase